MKKFTFLLSAEQRKFLEDRAERQDRSTGYILRELIDAELDVKEENQGDTDEESN
ncbi:hypothetical protein KGY71_00215 [Candidatus Bipolaricaulota bacterium]|nr:hypothetical protein [Candidatus Bipolaricaulota bacterium]MBS3792396.1 hypothetical protein [Candidatus Bipolaricaulota bacterium]MBS3813017.1 hypothetical protein [Candidatus Bipolaricaulota bacterium]